MAYIICEPCVGTCDTACVDVCPVDCIHTEEGWEKGDDPEGKMLYINPEDCIDCDACKPECPVEAIFPEEEVPEKWTQYIDINRKFFETENS
jgi:ferredoxin